MYIKSKQYLNKLINYIIWISNLLLFSIGIYTVTYNIDKFQDCDHTLIIIILGIVNNAVIFLGCNYYLQILNFCTNIVIFVFNIIKITYIDTNCETYIKNHHPLIWYFYLVQIYFQMFTIINYIFKLFLYFSPSIEEKLLINTEEQLLLNKN
jgi:hypothetical protein